jgi:hypothetical protein
MRLDPGHSIVERFRTEELDERFELWFPADASNRRDEAHRRAAPEASVGHEGVDDVATPAAETSACTAPSTTASAPSITARSRRSTLMNCATLKSTGA